MMKPKFKNAFIDHEEFNLYQDNEYLNILIINVIAIPNYCLVHFVYGCRLIGSLWANIKC